MRATIVVRVVILTSSELRHRFVRMCLALDDEFDVFRSCCEEPTAGPAAELDRRGDASEVERAHLRARSDAEHDFFGLFCALALLDQTVDLAPDVIAAFGCSIITAPLIRTFPERIVNLRLGLSPYYRGRGTSFWPLVNGEPELVGATSMYMDDGIDTGEMIDQIRPGCMWGTTHIGSGAA